MPTDNGKVIVSLLAGATAGIVAGLLLAPETGEDARKAIGQSASKWGGSLGKFLQDAAAKLQGQAPQPSTNAEAFVSEDRNAADALFNSMGGSTTSKPKAEPGDLTTSATGNGASIGGDDYADDNDLDYDGIGSDTRHRAL